MSKELKDYVTTGTCKIVTDATTEKINASQILLQAEIRGLRGQIYIAVATAITLISLLEFFLKLWRP